MAESGIANYAGIWMVYFKTTQPTPLIRLKACPESVGLDELGFCKPIYESEFAGTPLPSLPSDNRGKAVSILDPGLTLFPEVFYKGQQVGCDYMHGEDPSLVMCRWGGEHETTYREGQFVPLDELTTRDGTPISSLM